jgi:hypothetical protein
LWPEFERVDFLSELDGAASDALERRTVDGCLGAMLIYSQLAEELVRLLLRDVEFFIQLHLFPAEIHLPVRERATFGELLRDLERTMEFDGKQVVLKGCSLVNSARNQLVHRLTRRTSLSDLQPEMSRVRAAFLALLHEAMVAHDWFRLSFKDIAKDDGWWERVEADDA